jgi:hypothetical protein
VGPAPRRLRKPQNNSGSRRNSIKLAAANIASNILSTCCRNPYRDSPSAMKELSYGYPLMSGAIPQIGSAHDVKRVALQSNMTVIEKVRIGEIRRQRQIIVRRVMIE